MKPSLFFRVLRPEPRDKGQELFEMLQDSEHPERYSVEQSEFNLVPNSPFAYWISHSIRMSFQEIKPLKDLALTQHGASTKDDFRFLRLRWELDAHNIKHSRASLLNKSGWAIFAKGGKYSKYYADLYLCVNWGFDAEEIHEYVTGRYPYLKGNSSFILHKKNAYFHPGLTWPRRTNGLSFRAMPEGCIFADKGPAIFVRNDSEKSLSFLNAILTSLPFEMLVRLQLARTELAQSYEVGVIQNTPVPDSTPEQIEELSSLASHAHDLKRSLDTGNEVSHAFRLPWLLQFSGDSLTERGNAVASFQADTEQQLADIQDQIDDIAFDLYELSDEDRQLVREEMGVSASPSLTDEDDDVEADAEDDVETADADDEEEEIEAEDLDTYVHRLLSWCVGVVFGRWDVRFALNPELLPALQGAFERLPVVAPAGLVGPQGYPAEPGQMVPETWLRARPNVIALPEGDEGETLDGAAAYPLAVQWDGVLVSDPNHPRDIAARVREVLKVVFGERAADTEDEAVAVLRGTGRKPDSLEQYFAETRQFFDVHLKQYSKSRRKAPIYWPLQTKSGYTVWLYYPRINQDTLPRVLTEVLEPRISFQKVDVQRLEGQRAKLSSGPEFNKLGKELDEAKQLLGELRNMDAEIRMLINRGYSVDHNDGVVLSAAPLHKLIAWKEAAKEFKKLVKGEYPWCSQHTTWSEEQ